MRVLGLDMGARRVGVAVCDPDGRVAVPVTVVDRRQTPSLEAALGPIVHEYEAEALVVGLPIRTDGTEGPEAAGTRAEAVALGESLGLPVHLYDERLTTRIAHAAGREVGVGSKKMKRSVDMMAATLILQGWLDRRHHQGNDGLPS